MGYSWRSALGRRWKLLAPDVEDRRVMQEIVRQHDAGMSFRRISDHIEQAMATYEGRPYRTEAFRGQWNKSMVHRAYWAEKAIQVRERAFED